MKKRKSLAISRYKPFFRAGAMDLMAYKFHIFTWLIVTALQVLSVFFLWVAVYKNSPDVVINGFTFEQMVTFMVMINIFNFVAFDGYTGDVISDEVRDGTIANSFIKPISYRLRFVATNIGSISAKFLAFGLPMFIISYVTFLLLGYIVIQSIGTFLLSLLMFIVSLILASMLYDAFSYIFGVMSFYTTAYFGLFMLKETTIQFLSGTLVPLAFFPAGVYEIVKYLPFAGMAENPVLIFLMRDTPLVALQKIAITLGWLIVIEFFGWLLFRHASKKVTVGGG